MMMNSPRTSARLRIDRAIACAILIAIFIISAAAASAQKIPPVPEKFSFTNDYASLFERRTIDDLGKLQKATFEAHKTPIIVITVRSMAEYEWSGSIEGLAQAWFNAWGIGAPEKNTGILLLISLGDRKARIELGADWGRRWDGFCKRIMDREIVPHFKNGRYDKGTLEGVKALSEMAKLEPNGEIPEPGVAEKVSEVWQSDKPVSPLSPVPGKFFILMVGGGALCLVMGVSMGKRGGFFRNIGIFFIVLGPAFWIVVLFFIARFMLPLAMGASSFGGGFGSSGGFGGGFSGGGGASGSW